MEISWHTQIPLFTQGSVLSGSASWDDCDRMFPDELRVSLFLDRFPHYACTAAYSAHCDFVGSRVYACFSIICHLHFWQNDRGLLRATTVKQGWNGHRIRAHKVDSGEKNPFFSNIIKLKWADSFPKQRLEPTKVNKSCEPERKLKKKNRLADKIL